MAKLFGERNYRPLLFEIFRGRINIQCFRLDMNPLINDV